MGVDDADFNGDCYRSAVDSSDEQYTFFAHDARRTLGEGVDQFQNTGYVSIRLITGCATTLFDTKI